MVCAHTTYNPSQSLCTFYKINILLLYYIISLISESFIFFSMLHNYVTCDCDICDPSITLCDLDNHYI